MGIDFFGLKVYNNWLKLLDSEYDEVARKRKETAKPIELERGERKFEEREKEGTGESMK